MNPEHQRSLEERLQNLRLQQQGVLTKISTLRRQELQRQQLERDRQLLDVIEDRLRHRTPEQLERGRERHRAPEQRPIF